MADGDEQNTNQRAALGKVNINERTALDLGGLGPRKRAKLPGDAMDSSSSSDSGKQDASDGDPSGDYVPVEASRGKTTGVKRKRKDAAEGNQEATRAGPWTDPEFAALWTVWAKKVESLGGPANAKKLFVSRLQAAELIHRLMRIEAENLKAKSNDSERKSSCPAWVDNWLGPNGRSSNSVYVKCGSAAKEWSSRQELVNDKAKLAEFEALHPQSPDQWNAISVFAELDDTPLCSDDLSFSSVVEKPAADQLKKNQRLQEIRLNQVSTAVSLNRSLDKFFTNLSAVTEALPHGLPTVTREKLVQQYPVLQNFLAACGVSNTCLPALSAQGIKTTDQLLACTEEDLRDVPDLILGDRKLIIKQENA